jgi:hypothetical protein
MRVYRQTASQRLAPGGGRACTHSSTDGRKRLSPESEKDPANERGFPSAPERTRTSTDHSVHEALNPVRLV